MEKTRFKTWYRSIPFRWLIVISIGFLLLVWSQLTPEGLLGKADAIGYAVCHRIDLRSFHIGDRPLPLCARCSGMYLGAFVGLAFQYFVSRRSAGFPPLPVMIFMLVFVALFAVDGGNSFLALLFNHGLLYQPTNILRLFTGTGMGLVVATALFPAFNQTVWHDWSEKPAIGSTKTFLVMVLLAVVVDFFVLWEQPAVLYGLAILSAVSVLLILTLLYTMVYLMVTRQENQFAGIRHLSYALVIGFGVGLLQIGALDLVRFWFTGTWDGFHFG